MENRIKTMREIARRNRRLAVMATYRWQGAMPTVAEVLYAEERYDCAEAYDRAADACYLETYDRAVA